MLHHYKFTAWKQYGLSSSHFKPNRPSLRSRHQTWSYPTVTAAPLNIDTDTSDLSKYQEETRQEVKSGLQVDYQFTFFHILV